MTYFSAVTLIVEVWQCCLGQILQQRGRKKGVHGCWPANVETSEWYTVLQVERQGSVAPRRWARQTSLSSFPTWSEIPWWQMPKTPWWQADLELSTQQIKRTSSRKGKKKDRAERKKSRWNKASPLFFFSPLVDRRLQRHRGSFSWVNSL